MKAFKGCTNTDCIEYKKTHYKKDDQYCPKCGKPLSFVCAECWKPLEDGSEKYCISCKAKKEQKRAEQRDAVKKVGLGVGKAVTTVGIVVSGIAEAAKSSERLIKSYKEITNTAGDVLRIVKK